mmetsp:Transcript_13128/g.35162  ORF Transcript_13128/g.35162 Transcript_13128/m.35162 type:complete len:210 (+) Transcript_13128:2-631(+)
MRLPNPPTPPGSSSGRHEGKDAGPGAELHPSCGARGVDRKASLWHKASSRHATIGAPSAEPCASLRKMATSSSAAKTPVFATSLAKKLRPIAGKRMNRFMGRRRSCHVLGEQGDVVLNAGAQSLTVKFSGPSGLNSGRRSSETAVCGATCISAQRRNAHQRGSSLMRSPSERRSAAIDTECKAKNSSAPKRRAVCVRESSPMSSRKRRA